MVNSNHIKRGMALNIDGDLVVVVSFQHHKPGKGAAIVRVRIKSLAKGTTVERTFRSGEMLEDVELDKRPVSYSFEDGDNLVFMDTLTYDQIPVPKSDLSEILPFMSDGMEFSVLLYNDKPVSVIPPNFVEVEVSYAPEGLKGDTATTTYKEVELATGGKMQVPLFVKTGDIIKIDLRDLSYVERVNK
ncbi:MAG: elongation factor P [Leptospiraceae bacterium]|nr:elongation factor P [Leptospiraceae bacterium]MCB1199364.1 elongation factor P [Leptospiraceae bacterium]